MPSSAPQKARSGARVETANVYGSFIIWISSFLTTDVRRSASRRRRIGGVGESCAVLCWLAEII